MFWHSLAKQLCLSTITNKRSRPLSLFKELKRRNVFRVVLAYMVVSWLVLQVSDVFANALELPLLWSKALIALLGIGFIPVVVFSWVYEMTPEGIKKEAEINRDESVTVHTAKKLDIAVIGLLVVAIGMFAFEHFIGTPDVVRNPAAEDISVIDNSDSGIPVVAVLPLQSMSIDQEGIFLASGLHDDLLTRLAKLQAFRVISRTSVMEYADTTKNIRQIGQELGAGFIVEGGLQSIGGRVSINAQLIDAATDEHLWAETFNRPLTTANLFDVQAEIAGAISNALHTALSPSDVKALDEVPTESLDAYRAYLTGLEQAGTLTKPAMASTIEAFSEAVDLDPEYADAWARLTVALIRRYWEEGAENDAGPDPALREEASLALERARMLAPNDVDTLWAEAYFQYYAYRNYSAALQALDRAQTIAPNSHLVLGARGYVLRRLGQLDDSIEALKLALEYSPNAIGHIREIVNTLRVLGRCDEANFMTQKGLRLNPDHPGILLTSAETELICNDDADASQALINSLTITTPHQIDQVTQTLVLAGRFDLAIERIVAAQDLWEDDVLMDLTMANQLAWLYRQTGQEELGEASQKRASVAAASLDETGVQNLLQLAMAAALLGDAEKAVELGQRMMAQLPEDAFLEPESRYSALRVYAVAGVQEEAMRQLQSLLEIARFTEFRSLSIDPYLDPIRSNPQFQELMKEYATDN